MKHYSYIIIICAIALTSCSKNREIKLPTNFKEHHLPLNEVNIHKTIFKQVEGSNATYFTHREKTGVLYVYNFDSSKITQTFVLSKNIGKIADYIVHNDTFYALISPYGIAIQPLADKDGYQFYSLNRNDLGTGNYLDYESDGLHINVMSTRNIGTASLIKSFFKNDIDALITLNADTITIKKTSMNYPEDYANKLNINLTYVVKCVTPKQTFYSFGQSSELSFSNQSKIKKTKMNSNYFKETPNIDSLKLFDGEYIENVKGSDFCEIRYNPFRKEIYRSNYHSHNGVISKRPFSGKWSLVVADDKPDVKYEILFEGAKYIPTRIIPTRKGFAVIVVPENIEVKNELILHEYELE
jgi:hypothetical protein